MIAGGTGYMGSRLIPVLLARGHRVRAVARAGSEGRVSRGCDVVPGNVLDAASYAGSVEGCDTFVHLVGTPHPAPWKEREFRAIDLPSLRESVRAAAGAGVRNFVYVSVAHPAPAMHAYIRVRQECEAAIRDAGLRANILRPWYVLGPGHWWPYALLPFYRLAEWVPATRAGALRLGLVTLRQMAATLAWAVEHPAENTRVLGVPEIREHSV